ncbi:MAG: hypothetical protein AAB295_08245 [Chloroflexota bacterium]
MSAAAPARRGFRLPGYGTGEEPEWTVLATVAIALILGILVQNAVMGASRTVQVQGITLSYPANWGSARDAGTLFAARDRFGGAASASVSVAPVTETADVGTATSARTVALADRLVGFHTESTRRVTLGGRAAAQLEYAYVVAQTGSAPVLMRGIDTIASSGGKTYVLSFVAPAERFDELTAARLPRLSSTYDDILGSWRLP